MRPLDARPSEFTLGNHGIIEYRRLSMKVQRDQAETWAEWFAALADPTRILILNLLATERRPMPVGEIVDRLDVGQSTVSHHLRTLSSTCFVLVEPQGTSNRYRINERCLECFPTAAELVMGRGPRAAPWIGERELASPRAQAASARGRQTRRTSPARRS